MKILKEIYKDNELALSYFNTYFKGLNYAIFDIETTGLNHTDCHVILTGFVIPIGNGQFQLIQYFAQSISQETEVLEATLKILENLDFIITFNGNTFDIPFLKKRLQILNIHTEKDLSNIYNLDIYKIVKKFSDIKKFVPNLQQKTLENFLELYSSRLDQIDGKTSIKQYYEYLVTHNSQLEDNILLHNSDDVKQLYRLCNILKKVDFHKAMYQLGFPTTMTTIEKIRLSKNSFHLSGKTLLPNYCIYDDNADLQLNIFHGTLTLELKLNNRDGLLFVDLNHLFYECENLSFFDNDQLKYFANCNGLYLDHFLLLKVDGNINYLAVNLLAKYLIERIESNDN